MRRGPACPLSQWFWVVVFLLGAALSVYAQTDAAATGDQVTLYVPMLAKNGDQLRQLKPADLAITDAGRIVDSREVHLSFGAADRPPLLTFIFDRMPPADARTASRRAGEMLDACAGHAAPTGISASVWSIDTQLRIVQPYTDDTSAVRKAIAQMGANTAKAVDAGGAPEQMDMAGKSLAAAARIVAERRAPWSYAAILAAARAQRQRPGRKAVVLFTEQTTFDVNAPDRYRELQQALKDAHASLYVVDVNTLDGGESQQLVASSAMGGQATSNYYTVLANIHSTAPLATTMGMGAMGFQAMKDTITNIEMGAGQQDGNPLARAALASGGTYSFADASAKKLGQRMMAELSSYMTVGYTIPADQQDGRYHAVSIKPVRPGVSVAAQPGYFAAQGADEASGALLRRTTSAPIEGDLALLEQDATPAELPFRAAVLRFGRSSAGQRMAVAVEVPVSGLRLQEDGHTRLFSLRATIGVELTGEAGKVVTRFQEEFRRRGAMDAEANTAGDVLSLVRSLSLVPGTYTLRCTVRDWNARTWSRSAQPVKVGAAEAVSALSDLLVVRETRPAPVAGEEAALQYGEKQVVPNLSGELRRGRRRRHSTSSSTRRMAVRSRAVLRWWSQKMERRSPGFR